ncbi:MAG: hypothetical protein FD138_1122 [Planctomycetota bacterium]|nr:MAG: hypothetical protein FD138_1122 [Planctomycetota bacterium]
MHQLLRDRDVELFEQREHRIDLLLKGCSNNRIPGQLVLNHLSRIHNIGDYLELGSAEILEHLKWLNQLDERRVLVSDVHETHLPRIQPDATEYRFLVVGIDGHMVLNALSDCISRGMGLEISGGRQFAYTPAERISNETGDVKLRLTDRYICEFSVICANPELKDAEILRARLQTILENRLTGKAISPENTNCFNSLPSRCVNSPENESIPNLEGKMPGHQIEGQEVQNLRQRLGLTRHEFAQLFLAASEEEVEKWEGSDAVPPPVVQRFAELQELVRELSDYGSLEIHDWLQTPVSLFGEKTPIEVIAAGMAVRVLRAIDRVRHGTVA